MNELKFDVVLHLAGEQAVPNYMAVKLSEAQQHILLTTKKTKAQYKLLAQMFPSEERLIRHVEVEATDYAAIRTTVSGISGLEGKKIGVNVTGGTKPMFAAALDVCREKGFTPFYIDTQERMISFFTSDYLKLPMPRAFETVEEFVRLGNYKIKGKVKRSDDIPDVRRDLIKHFWDNRDWVRRVIGDFSKATDKKYQSQKTRPPECYQNALSLILNPRKGNKKEESLAIAWERTFPPRTCDWRVAARFGAGEWFEEWLLLQFANSRRSSDFCDLCSGLSLTFASGDNDKSIQEIDVAFTDGYMLTLIECKAGAVYQDHIQKLENLRRQIGGAMGRGFLCAINYQDTSDVIVERVRNGNISLITGDKALRMLPNRQEMIKPRRCYQGERDYEQ